MGIKEYYRYPEELKDEFIATEDIVFRDGTRKSAEEIWHFMTEEAPVRYPYAFTRSNHYHRRLSRDVTLPSTIKHNYLILTMNERISGARAKGTPVIFVQGGQSVDPYYAAGAIALRPASTGLWAAGQHEGLNLNQEELRRMNQREKAHHATSFEICQTAGYENIQEGNLPVDMIAPFTCLRCSDISYGVEAHRHGKRKLNLFLGDYPLSHQKDKPWAIEYFARNLRRLTKEINEFTGRETTDADLWAEIRLHNAGRRLAVDTAEAWWSADAPPTNGIDRRAIFQMGSMEVHGDPSASLTVLKEANRYIKERVKKGIKGEGVQDNPARIFVCGSCVRPNEFRTEEAGGIMVGNDNHWSDISTIVDEEGDDPFYNLSRAILSYPYEQDIKGRAAWTVEQLRKSRAHGVMFLYNWGCNTQSAIARMLCDEVKKQTKLPSLIIEHDRGGVQSEQLQNRVNAFVEMVRP
jgi:benzoyl-CoA reductase/2-hydroxyglutaryl-CoA dehydratase subunit BcrC/BadD/HgdB